MSTLSLHNVVKVEEKINHYTKGMEFVCRTLTITTQDGSSFDVSLFTQNDEHSILPTKTERSFYNA